MSDETPDQVTLDNLQPVGYLDTLTATEPLVMCSRCASAVTEFHWSRHLDWHAAIEAAADPRLSTLRRAELDRLAETIRQSGAAAPAQPGEFQPLRDQLIQQLKDTTIDRPAAWVDLLMPVIEAWAEKYLSRATVAESLLARVRSEPPFGLRQALLDALQVEDTGQDIVALVRELRAEYGKLELAAERELERLRRLEQAVMELGAPANTDQAIEWLREQPTQPRLRDRLRKVVDAADCPPGAGMVEWVETQLAELDEHRKHDCQWTTDDVNARMNEQRAAFVGLLQLAGRGRAAYAENLGKDFVGRDTLMTQADNFHAAARLIADPTRICLQIPASMLPEAGDLVDDESVAAPPVTDSLAAKISQAIHDPGKFVDRAREWDDTWDRWEYESVAAWGARAVIEVLNSVDADVDVPERPGFLVPDRFPGVVNVRSLKDTEDVWMCSRCEQRSGMMGHPNGCPKPGTVNMGDPEPAVERAVDAPERPASTDEPAEAEVCPSLYLHNGQLLCCTTAISPANEHGHAHYLEPVDGRLNCVQWIDSQAVPVPWPLDQEPPAGIDVLEDIRLMSLPGEQFRYLCRVGADRWSWEVERRAFTSDEIDHAHSSTWTEAIHNAGRLPEPLELHVVWP